MSTVRHLDLRTISADVLRRVEAGEEVVVTYQGRPVARLLPLESAGSDDLERRGEVRTARSDWSTLPPPVPAPEGVTTAELLADLRGAR